jgi:hypothetical protein
VKNSALHPFEIPSSQIQIARVGPKLQDFAISRLADLEVFLAEKSPMRDSSLVSFENVVRAVSSADPNIQAAGSLSMVQSIGPSRGVQSVGKYYAILFN